MQAAVAAAGGKVFARSNQVIGLNGTPPKLVAIVAFDGVDSARAWFSSDALKEANAARTKGGKSRLFIVEELSN